MTSNATASHPVIAIDGPAASGKSTVARRLALRLGIAYVNTGEMYRAATWYVLSRGVGCSDAAAIAHTIESAPIETGIRDGLSFIRIGRDMDPGELCAGEVNTAVSCVAAVPAVRRVLVARQRALAAEQPVVMEGRDIGSFVFPSTPFKFYVDASPEIRRKRRFAQGQIDDPGERDRADSSRADAPLMVAGGAEVIDSSHLAIDEVVDEILARIARRGFPVPTP